MLESRVVLKQVYMLESQILQVFKAHLYQLYIFFIFYCFQPNVPFSELLGLIGALCASYLIDKQGRKKLLIGSYLGMVNIVLFIKNFSLI